MGAHSIFEGQIRKNVCFVVFGKDGVADWDRRVRVEILYAFLRTFHSEHSMNAKQKQQFFVACFPEHGEH